MSIRRVAFRNFFRNLHRYRLLLSAFVAAVTVLVFITGIVGGMTSVLREKASLYFAGEISILGYGRHSGSLIPDSDAIVAAVEGLLGPDDVLVKRSLYLLQNSELFFAGNSFRQRRLIGVDWERESRFLQGLDIVEGEVPTGEDGFGGADAGIGVGSDGGATMHGASVYGAPVHSAPLALISTKTAERLGARVGDTITLLIGDPASGVARNTVTLSIAGLYRDSSFFGYAVYLGREVLNRLRAVPETEVNEIGVRTPGDEAELARRIQARLAQDLPVFPVLLSQAERDSAIRGLDTLTYAILPIEANLAEVKDLLDAFTALAVVLVLIFLTIVMIGVSNTYTMIVHERTKELGTLRALGLSRPGVLRLFLYESLFLSVTSIALGLALGFGLLALTSLLDFGSQPWAALFLSGGKLAWIVNPAILALLVAVVALAGLFGCLRPAVAASRMAPVDALRAE